MEGFTHLHVSSGYSTRYGASHPRDLVLRAAERGMTTLAVTDRDSVTAVVRFAKAAAEHGVRPVFGVDLAVEPLAGPRAADGPRTAGEPRPADGRRPAAPARAPGPAWPDPYRPADRERPGQRRRTPVRGGAHLQEPPLRFTLLARDAPGWAALCRLVSAAHAHPVDGYPVVSWAALRRYAGPSDGLFALLGPVSEPVRALQAGRPDLAGRLIEPWRDLFGPSLRLETVWHGRSPAPGALGGRPAPGAQRTQRTGPGAPRAALDARSTGPGSLRLAARTLQFADRAGVPAVLANAVRYADPAQHRLADVLDAARLLRPVDPRRLDSGQRWLKGPSEMHAVAERIAEAAGLGRGRAARLLARTVETGELCRVDPVADLGLGRRQLPEPHTVGAVDAADAARVLRQRCEAGLVRRGLDRDPAARARLEEELALISELEFDTYFLTVAQVVSDVREMGIRVAARGSGAGSMVNHALHIATANPLEHRLLFARFMSRQRTDLPDIDLDVESARRLEVYDRIIERFGRERVAITGMPETYRARHALRDTGLALGIAPGEVDRIAKSFPHIRASDITAALAELPELSRLAAGAAPYRLLFELAEGLDALPRGIAMHPCGVILTNASLLDRLPVQPTPTGGYPMVQADKEDVEDLGMIKLDVLGVRMQSAMAHATAEIERATGRRVDLDDPRQVPLDDHFAFKLIQASDTLGMFQLESPGQMDLLGRLQPRDPQDVIADISLFRPGPVAGGMPEQYVAARHGRPVTLPHRDLEEVLSDTYGVVIWHEQIIEMFHAMTGCDHGFGDYARRALSDRARLPLVRDWFHRRAAARGYSPAVRETVWKTIEAFGAYGFSRAHAVAFAVPALQSAWLKAHHPAALYAGLLEHDPGMWPKRVIVADARRHGIAVLSVDVNRSRPTHTIERAADGSWGVRLALSQVRGISEDEVARIAAGQPYTSLADLWQRARPHRPTAERLVNIGALDGLNALDVSNGPDVPDALDVRDVLGASGPRGGGSGGRGGRGGRGPTRRDLLLQIAELHRQYRGRPLDDGQLPIQGYDPHTRSAGLPEMTGREALSAELNVLGMDVTRHLMDHHHRLLRELGAVDAKHLSELRAGETVLVAGVRAATQTPPIASGKRIIFVTLDDGSGLVDLAFFEDSHAACAHTVFHSGLLLVRGAVQRRGGRGTVVGTMAWDLEALAVARRDDGPEAVHRLLGTGGLGGSAGAAGTTRAVGADGADGAAVRPDGQRGRGRGPGHGHGHGPGAPSRTIPQETGARLHPWADLRPAGERAADPRALDPGPDSTDLKTLGYTSPGSAG
ncbi:DNA polymerase III subunit alpha [Streptomyces sp. NPDC014894]|uniref:DNA polymerase III subunit alpha n=1 Tax=Streptomyces sp. NPDC014894 TaxID=3364931 RepID=UPI0036FB99A5